MSNKNKTWDEMYDYIIHHEHNICKKPYVSNNSYRWYTTGVFCYQSTLIIPPLPTHSTDGFLEANLMFWYCHDPIELGNENFRKKMPLLQLRFVTRKRTQNWNWTSGIHEKDGDYDLNISYFKQDDTTKYSSQQWDLVVPAPYTKREEQCVDEFMSVVNDTYEDIYKKIESEHDSFSFGEESDRHWANAIYKKMRTDNPGLHNIG